MLTEYPIWLGLVCLVLASGGTWFLYRNNPIGLEGRYASITQKILVGIRFLSLFIIAFLLLGPLLQLVNTETQKPIIAFAVDNSQSMQVGNDTAKLNQTLTEQLNVLKSKLGDEYEVVPYTIGKQTNEGSQFAFNEKQTDLNALFTTLKTTYDGSNLGAVILASDGLYNHGENPLNAAANLRVPTFAIALGDTVQHKDVFVKNTRANQYVFKGNSFPLQIDVAAFAAAGNNTILSVTQNGKSVLKQTLSLSNNYFNSVSTQLTADDNNTQHIVVELSTIKNEVSTVNNRADLFIEVLDSKQKIALIAFTPHPDVMAYQKALTQSQRYSVDVFITSQQQTPSKLDEYNLAIVHQLPSLNADGVGLIKQLKDKNIPILYIIGAQTNTALLNQLEPNFQLNGGRGNTNEVMPVYQNNFSLFTLTADEQEHIKKYPPLVAPFGNYTFRGEAEVLFKQQIGYIKTDYPLILFAKGEGQKSGFICGEGFWKWRLYDQAISEQKTTGTLVGNMAQYLTSKKDKGRFRVNHKKEIEEGENLIMDAELYNESFQLINTAEVSIMIKNSSGKNYPFTFTKTTDAYTLDAGVLEAGKYTYEASAKLGGTVISHKGQFIIKPLQVEFAQTTANHQLLNELATQSAGKIYYTSTMQKLVDDLKNSEKIKPVIYEHNETKSWIELKWIFILLATLLSLEWFIRKWNGSI